MRRHPDPADQIRAMTRAFLARFFENEITTGTDDLKTFFFWLVAFLAAPGFLLPVMMGFRWQLIARVKGPEALYLLSRADKTLYIGFVMIASATIAAVTWNSLLGDRRDALVLGVLPVRPAAIVGARLCALAIYIIGIGVAMNALASVTFGMGLGGQSFRFAVHIMVAHFTATVASTACIFLWVTGLQGIVLAALGPRLFSRVAPMMQVLLVGAIVAGFLSLPAITGSVVDALSAHGPASRRWILATPPLWFLGLYEWVLGTRDPQLVRLAGTAAMGVGVGAFATVMTYPLAYRRIVTAAVEQGSGYTRAPVARTIAAWLIRASGHASHVRAVMQFLLAALGRVEANRFVLAASLGIVVAWVMPGWLSMAASRPDAPRVLLLSVSYSAIVFLVFGLNIAASLPTDQKSAWMFDVTPPGRRHARAALERTMFFFGVVPALVIFVPLYGALWGLPFAATHGLFMLLMGVLAIQFALRRADGMPCAQPWDPQRLDLGRWWAAYLIGFILYTTKIPDVELALVDHPIGIAVFSLVTVFVAAMLRIRSLRRRNLDIDTSAFAPGDVLSLN